jgi:hypothetical protein
MSKISKNVTFHEGFANLETKAKGRENWLIGVA